MSSGVSVNPKCIEEFKKLKLEKKIKYIIYTVNPGNTEIVLEKTSPSPSYDAFLADLPPAECRYAVYDFEYDTGEGKRNKICFIAWSPDEARIKNKMIYASSKDVLRKSLIGIGTEVQATDASEAAYEAVMEKCTRR